MRIATLVENTPGESGCRCEHGLSFYIETEEHRILMDTGASDLLLENAEKLGTDLTQVDTVILSHGHHDHGNGIPCFAGINPGAEIYLQASALDGYYSRHGDEAQPRYIGLDPEIAELPRLVRVTGDLRIDDELFLFSGIPAKRPVPGSNSSLLRRAGGRFVPDTFAHEQCLAVTQGGRQYLFSGCAHHGIRNIMDHYVSLFGREPDAVFSGFHLRRRDGRYSEEDIREIKDTAAELRKYRTVFYTGHCTGEQPFEILREIMGGQIRYVHCGDIIMEI